MRDPARSLALDSAVPLALPVHYCMLRTALAAASATRERLQAYAIGFSMFSGWRFE